MIALARRGTSCGSSHFRQSYRCIRTHQHLIFYQNIMQAGMRQAQITLSSPYTHRKNPPPQGGGTAQCAGELLRDFRQSSLGSQCTGVGADADARAGSAVALGEDVAKDQLAAGQQVLNRLIIRTQHAALRVHQQAPQRYRTCRPGPAHKRTQDRSRGRGSHRRCHTHRNPSG